MLCWPSPEDRDDAEGADDAPEDLSDTLRRTFLQQQSSGSFLEVVQLRGSQCVEHRVLPPWQDATIAAVSLQVGRGVAWVGDVELRSGQNITLSLPDGELWLRFVPSPTLLVGADASRLALVLLLMVACLSALSGTTDRVREPPGTPAAAHVETASAQARRRRQSARHVGRIHRRITRRAAARRHSTPRAVRPARRTGPRRCAPAADADGGDGGDPDPEPLRARRPRARARDPPAATSPSLFRSHCLRRTSCSWCRSS